MNEFIERLGWVLVHSLWQFALVALLAGVISRAMRRSSSAARYGVLVVAMAVMIVVPLATWFVLPSNARDDLASGRALAPGQVPNVANSPGADAARLTRATKFEDPTPDDAASIRRAGGVSPPVVATSLNSESTGGLTPPARQETLSWSQRVKTALQPWLTWIVAVWCIGVAVCSLRPLLGWHTLWQLKRVGVSPVSNDVLAVMQRVTERFRLRRAVSVLQSTLAQVPVVVGYLRPVVLLPVSLMTSLPAEQLEAILAHELAHVRRHDFVVNLLQTLVETFFFYHPAVWWLSRQIRVEREHCCDDLVVASFGNRIEYGRALLAIEALRGRSSVLALGAADGSLLSRIRRIVRLDSEHAANEQWPASFISLVLIGVTCALSMTWNLAAKDDVTQERHPAIAKLPHAGSDDSDEGREKPEPIDEEAVRLRGVGQKFFSLADYVPMAAAYAELCDRTSATIDDHLWHGHALQLARNWPAAVKAYHEALIKLDAQIAATEIKLKPLEEQVKLDESIKLMRGNPYLSLKRDQEQLPKRRPDLVLLIGHLELVELKNPAAAAKTLSQGLRFAPELAVPLAELLAKAEAAVKTKPDYLRGMQFIDPLETQRFLAMAQEQLNQPAAALDTWSRVRLGKLVYPSSYATTEPAHLKELASKLPQDSLQPHHRFVLKTPDRELLKPREAKDFLKVGPANPFQATPLPGVELTTIGPSANSLVQLPDGRLLMAFASGDQHHIGIKLSSSTNGTEWDAPWEFAHNNVFDTRAPSLLVDDDGVIWMLCLSKRLTTERFASGPYELWLTHSRDGRDWSPLRSLQMRSESDPPRIATGQYQELAQLTRLPDRRFGIFHAGHFGAAASPGLLTTLSQLSLPIDKEQHVNNPHATFDSDGRCHLVFDDFGRGLYYTRSNDLREWSPLQKLGVPEKNSSISRPQLLLADGRVALIHEKNSGTWLQRGTIAANGLQLGEATQVTDHLMPLNGSRLLRVGDRVLIPAGTPPCISHLLSAPIAELLK